MAFGNWHSQGYEERKLTKPSRTHGNGGWRFYIAQGFIVGKNVFAGVKAASWRGPWSDYISYARYISTVPAGRPGRRFCPSRPRSTSVYTVHTITTTTTATTVRTPFLNATSPPRGFFRPNKRFSYYFGEFLRRSVHDITSNGSVLLYLTLLLF